MILIEHGFSRIERIYADKKNIQKKVNIKFVKITIF